MLCLSVPFSQDVHQISFKKQLYPLGSVPRINNRQIILFSNVSFIVILKSKVVEVMEENAVFNTRYLALRRSSSTLYC